MTKASILACALVLCATGCQDLDISNPNNPNRESVLQSSSDLQSLVSTSFRTWFSILRAFPSH